MTEASFVTEMHEAGSFGAIWSRRRRPPVVLFEVPTADGIPDIVVCDVDQGAVRTRLQAGLGGPIRDTRTLAVLLAMQRSRPISSQCVAAKLRYDENTVTRVLGSLSDAGYVEEHGRGIYVRRPEFKPVVRYTVAIEAKLRDWDRVLYQASRHRYFANESWAVLPRAYAATAVRNAELFAQYGLGLAVYDGGVLTTVLQARAQEPVSRLANAQVAEVVLSMISEK